MIEEYILQILVCPACKSDLNQRGDFLICDNCSRRYSIIKGIPVLLENFEHELEISRQIWERLYRNKLLTSNCINVEDDPEVNASFRYIKKFGNLKGRFLEAGCGLAKNAFLLSKEGTEVICCDYSLSALIASKKLFEREQINGFFVCANLLNMPFKSNVFSCVYAGGVIEHAEKTVELLREIRRCQVEGGIVLATFPCISLSLPYLLRRGNIPDLFLLKDVLSFIHFRLLRGRLAEFGFEKSFLTYFAKRIFMEAGFSSIESGYFETFYPLNRFPFASLKNALRKLSRHRLFWPMAYVNATK